MKKVAKRSGKAGLPPGSLIRVGGKERIKGKAHVFVFNAEAVREFDMLDLSELPNLDPEKEVFWLDLGDPDDLDLITAMVERFDLHTLMMEDILNFDHRPKVEEFPGHLFVICKMLMIDKDTRSIRTEQVSFVLGKGYVLSFQETTGDVLDPIRERLRNNLGRVRQRGADYLVYALLDVIVDNYYLVLDELGVRIEQLERKVTARPGNEDLYIIQQIRSELITVGKYIMPTRELAGRLNILESDLLDKGTRRYINDLQDHTVYIAESIGTLRDMLASLENTYHAMVNLRMGQVVKVLTVISTIFIPLTFIVGVYGMNFRYMPELDMRHGYYAVLALMGLIAVGMVIWLKRRRWL